MSATVLVHVFGHRAPVTADEMSRNAAANDLAAAMSPQWLEAFDRASRTPTPREASTVRTDTQASAPKEARA